MIEYMTINDKDEPINFKTLAQAKKAIASYTVDKTIYKYDTDEQQIVSYINE